MTNLFRSLLLFAIVGTHVTPVAAQAVWRQVARLTPPEGDRYGQFGYSVAYSSGSILVGSPELVPLVDPAAGFDDTAYEFSRADKRIEHEFYSNPAPYYSTVFLGTDIASNDEVTVITDVGDFARAGAAYLYNQATGELVGKLDAGVRPAVERFGASVAISESRLLVSAYTYSGLSGGSAYLFDLETGERLHRFQGLEYTRDQYYGSGIALTSTHAFVGSPNALNRGAVYAYSLETSEQTLAYYPPTSDASDFGTSLDIDGDLLVIGDPRADVDRISAGSAFVYNAATGAFLHRLTAPDANASANFGRSVAIDNGLIVVGAYGDNEKGDFAGAAYVYDAATGDFLAKLTAADAQSRELFGSDVDIDNGEILVGAPGVRDYGQYGVVYAFQAVLRGDYDGDGHVTLNDYDAWASASSRTTGDLLADGNGDGVVDAADYTVWRDAYAATTSANSVPEPESLLGLSFAMIGLLLRDGIHRHHSRRFV